MPMYAKFLKEIMSNKRKLEDLETVAMTSMSSVMVQNRMPPKI